MMQNPLATTCTGTDPLNPAETFQGNNNRSATRIAKVDITDPANPVLVGDFLYTIDTNAATGTPVNSQLRISDVYWVAPDQLLVDERDDTAGTAPQGGTSTTYKRIYRVNLTGATNIQALPAANQNCIDALKPSGVVARGAIAGTKTLVLDLASTAASPEYPFDKLEGLVQRENGNFATVNDNDFSVANLPPGPPKPTRYIEYGAGPPAPVVPEVTWAILLPLTALGIGGVALAAQRRRWRVRVPA
jgi:Esterase-like activity of phytase